MTDEEAEWLESYKVGEIGLDDDEPSVPVVAIGKGEPGYDLLEQALDILDTAGKLVSMADQLVQTAKGMRVKGEEMFQRALIEHAKTKPS